MKNVSVSGLFWGAHLIHDPKVRAALSVPEAALSVTPTRQRVCAPRSATRALPKLRCAPRASQAILDSAKQLIEWWAAGEIQPHIGERVALSRANEAFDLITGRGSTGKVVLVP